MKVISLGVGIQSTALYYMSSLGELPRADVAIFADTGGEKSATLQYYEFLKKWAKKNNGIELHVASYKNLTSYLKNKTNSTGNRFASIPAFTKDSEGKSGMLRRQCTAEYKIQQVDKKIKEILGLTKHARFPDCEIWQGITLDEIERLKRPIQKWKIAYYPFCGYAINWKGEMIKLTDERKTRGDIINWYKEKNLPLPEKSSCVFCPFQSDSGWIRLKNTAPNDFKQAIEIDKVIRDSTRRGIKNPIYLHRSLKPLDEVNFDESQTTMWGDCYGYCHI